MSNATNVESQVFEMLQKYSPKKDGFTFDSKIIADLRLTSDDATQLALDLESQLKVRIPRQKWRDVHTVKDLIDLVSQYSATN
jgi:acyl carrier protein